MILCSIFFGLCLATQRAQAAEKSEQEAYQAGKQQQSAGQYTEALKWYSGSAMEVMISEGKHCSGG